MGYSRAPKSSRGLMSAASARAKYPVPMSEAISSDMRFGRAAARA